MLPHSTAEVSATLTALIDVNHGAGDWHIAVRSGGHSSIGSNNIARGVTIDLSMMNSSSYDREANLARIQPGGRWRNVYADLERDGVTVAGGRDGDVGVGGFLLGGGLSFFSGRKGFGCDTVVNYEVVLANGSVIDANSTANTELWRALKGGSSNFGIVTRFDMEAIPARDLFYDLRVLGSTKDSDTVVDAVVGFADQDESLAENSLISLYEYNPSYGPEIVTILIHVNTLGNDDTPTAFEGVKGLPVVSNSTLVQGMAKAAAGSQLAGGSRFVIRPTKRGTG